MSQKDGNASSLLQQDDLNPPPSASASSSNNASSSPLDMISITVAPFTGGPFLLRISKRDSVEELKKAVAKKLKVLKDRICLLYRESQLSDGSLEDNFVADGARITLLPRAETGLLAQKPEQSVMQALESLNDSQVNDFLSGKAPLNLTMRLGDHMMLIQLQLSTVNAVAASSLHNNKRSRSSLDSRWSTNSPTSAAGSSSSNTSTNNTQGPSSSSSSSSGTSGSSYRPKLDTRALAEASKNLTQTLKQLSSEVLTNKPSSGDSDEIPSKRPRMTSGSGTSQQRSPPSTSLPSFSPASGPATNPSPGNTSHTSNENPTASKPQQSTHHSTSSSKSHSKNGGAIIESMHHHGKGVYSGTFSGTLNPALQDKNGQPKRDITTIIHILNDLLCAQYKNYNSATNAAGASSGRKTENYGTATNNSSDPNIPTEPQRVPSAESLHRSKMEQLQVTRDKMEALRRVMEERKAQRRARREARSSPYSTSWSLRSSDDSRGEAVVENIQSSSSASPSTSSSVASSPGPSPPASVVSSPPGSASAGDNQIYEPETVTAA